MEPEALTQNPLEWAGEVWSRRKWLAILTFLPLAAAAVSLVMFLPNLYQSTAIVLVDRQQVPEDLVRPTVTSALETRLQTINQEILSRSRLEQLISRFGLYPDLRRRVAPEEVIERMRGDITLELRGDARAVDARGGRATIAFAIGYRGSDPQTVAQVTNTLASFYIEENLKVRERQATGTADFLRVQLDQVKARLDEQEKRVSEFKKRFVGELPQEMEVNLATLERLNAQLRLNVDNQTRALERREMFDRQMAEAGWVIGPSGGTASSLVTGTDPTTARIARLRQDLAELKTRFSDKYPDMVRIKAEIAALERELAQGKTNGQADRNSEDRAPMPPVPPDPRVLRMWQAAGEAEAEIKILKAEEERLRKAIPDYQRRIQETPLREQQYKELARDYEATKELYNSLLKRHAESQIAESMEQRQKGEQFRVIEPALPAALPMAPNRILLLPVGLGIAFGVALGAVVLAELLNSSFHTVDTLRAFTNVPVLVSIPRILTSADVARRRRLNRLVAASALAGLLLIVSASYWIAHGNEYLVSLLQGRRS